MRKNRGVVVSLFTGFMATSVVSFSGFASDAGSLSAEGSRAIAQNIARALANPARPVADREMDAARRPAEVLAFFQIQRGMTVLDVFGGGGYYAEIVSYVVGDSGFVTLYNNRAWQNYVAKALVARFDVTTTLDEEIHEGADDKAASRLPNVDKYTASPADLINQPDEFDAAIFVLGMHDAYVTDVENGWPAIDRKRFFAGIYKLITPGGVLGVVDHNAAAGTDPIVVSKTLHRIDPAVIVRDLEAVGFELEASSDVLKNPADDHSVPATQGERRWHTDRSVLRFRKPASRQ
jgi:predicted methyltransferase